MSRHDPIWIVDVIEQLIGALIDLLDADTDEERSAARAQAQRVLHLARGER